MDAGIFQIQIEAVIGVWRSDIAIDNIEFTKGACPPITPTTISPTTQKMATSTPTIPFHLLSESKTLIIHPVTNRSLVNLSPKTCQIPSFVLMITTRICVGCEVIANPTNMSHYLQRYHYHRLILKRVLCRLLYHS